MLKGLRVPTHAVDAAGCYIFPHDAAWDRERINVECLALVDLALVEARVAVEVEGLSSAQVAAVAAAVAATGAVEVEGLSAEQVAAAVEAVEAVDLDDAGRDAAEARHPWNRYRSGAGRYDLDAEDQGPHGRVTPRGYLRPDAVPTVFYLRRIPYKERLAIDVDNDAPSRWSRLVIAGVSKIAEGDAVIWEASKKTPRMPEAMLEALCQSEGGTMNLLTLAGACSLYSGPITASEGKR